MNRFSICIAACLLASTFEARGDDVRESLDKAKNEYEQSQSKYQDIANEYFDKREEAARKQGNKKLVDQIKGERETFEATGELPPTAPATIRVRPLSALTILTRAYTNAVKECTRTKQDDLAAAIAKELAEIKAKAGFPSIEGVWQEGPEDNRIRVTVTQIGDRFRATCTYQHKEHGEIRWRMTGAISKDGEIKGELVHTKAPRGWSLKQTRTAKYSAIDGAIVGHAEWQGGGHDFEWKLISD